MSVGVVIPCFNHNKEVVEAIKSCLKQREKFDEIIVVDDGSFEPVVYDDKRVEIIRHPKNLGLSAALNTGIRKLNTTRFVILAADDRLHPAYVGMMSDVDDDIVSCNMMVHNRTIKGRPASLELLKRGNCHSYAALVKKYWWRATGGFKNTMNPSWEDYEFWVNCAKLGAHWTHVNASLHEYNHSHTGRDGQAQGMDIMLRSKLEGYHQDVFGEGRGEVAVIIPCYNHEKYVFEAVDSALTQTYPHVRVVVVDDGSPGNVQAALGSLVPKITLLKKENGGLASARNYGAQYAIDKWKSQYFVMLDADDKISSDFIERCMSELRRPREYAYTDVQFFGSATHTFQVEDFNCDTAVKRHLHACTFLMPSEMYTDVIALRGYGYDESELMRIGYEDWEFNLAAIRASWCGRRLENYYGFWYRQHPNGSMRTEAKNHKEKLVRYIKTKNLGSDILMGCKTCGGSRNFKVVQDAGAVQVSSLGQLAPGEPLKVTYIGDNLSTQTKVIGGRIYKYSGSTDKTYGPTFYVPAKDASWFVNGPFRIEKTQARRVEVHPGETKEEALKRMPTEIEPEKPAVEKVPKPDKQRSEDDPIVDRIKKEFAEARKKKESDLELADIPGVGPKIASYLQEAGFNTVVDVATASLSDLADKVQGMNRANAKRLRGSARELLK